MSDAVEVAVPVEVPVAVSKWAFLKRLAWHVFLFWAVQNVLLTLTGLATNAGRNTTDVAVEGRPPPPPKASAAASPNALKLGTPLQLYVYISEQDQLARVDAAEQVWQHDFVYGDWRQSHVRLFSFLFFFFPRCLSDLYRWT
jgi:hypothetical protein